MKLLAEYHNRTDGTSYWRTIRANDLTEAMRIAARFARKGFRCINLEQVV